MKINNIGAGTRAGIEKKKKAVKIGDFHTLLKSSLDKIGTHEEGGRKEGGGEKQGGREAVRLIRDATRMLDRAMEQIYENGEPDQAVVESLQILSRNLGQIDGYAAPEEKKIADVLVAVEAQRLRNW